MNDEGTEILMALAGSAPSRPTADRRRSWWPAGSPISATSVLQKTLTNTAKAPQPSWLLPLNPIAGQTDNLHRISGQPAPFPAF